MTDGELVKLSERYFLAIDARDPDALAETLAEGCVLTIETHTIVYEGRDAIRTLFASRWSGPLKAIHHDFTHSPSSSTGRVASQFTVTYSGPEAPEPKSNANIFSMRDGKITRIAVYMAGANTVKT